MRKSLLALATATALATIGSAQAAPLSGDGIRAAIDATSPIEKAQVFVYEGNRYCFYFNGWHGPGWYRCGFAWRRGFGWGGVYGWHGWSNPAWERRHRHGNIERHDGRRGDIEHRDRIRSGSNVETRGRVTTRSRSQSFQGNTRTHVGGEMRGTTGMGSHSSGPAIKSGGGAKMNVAPGGGAKAGGGARGFGEKR
jgi:hypothetical protein